MRDMNEAPIIMVGDLPNILAKKLGRPIETLKDLKECMDKGFIEEYPEFLEALSKAMEEEDDAEDDDDL